MWQFTLTPECEFDIFDEKERALTRSDKSLLSGHYCEGGLIPSESELERIVDLLNKGKQFESEKKYWNCKTHGEALYAWGCPECVRQLRELLDEALKFVPGSSGVYLRAEKLLKESQCQAKV